ncbi:MAG: hypothetical protein IKW51_07315 [Bacteroidales bacterium]|nr:hypothetical protein [Bacteroidales bacterium]
MSNIFFYIITFVFGACCAFITWLSKIFGWTYTETCVYINLYLQYAVLLLSTLSVIYVAAKKIRQGFSKRGLLVLITSVVYNVPFVWFGIWLYNRYGKISCDAAFELCKNDLLELGEFLDIPKNISCYTEGWTEYYVVNIIIFIVLYLLAFFINWSVKKLIKKYV